VSTLQEQTPGDPTLEIDAYAGWATDWESGLSLDAYVEFYFYGFDGGEVDYDYSEFNLRLGQQIGNVEIAGTLEYANDYYGGTGEWWSVLGEVNWSLDDHVHLTTELGYQWFEDEVLNWPDYLDAEVALTVSFDPVSFVAAVSTNDLDESLCGEVCETRVWFGLNVAI
jgi:uncharacterized protein (TIGR02001 family)